MVSIGMEQKPKRAYVTALTKKNYIPGVMALAKALINVNSAYSLAVMVPESERDLLVEAMKRYGVMQCGNVVVIAKTGIKVNDCDNAGKYAYWKDTFFKLAAVDLVQFEKIVLVDSDMLINQNIDCLFEMPNISGVMAGLCERPTWKNLNSGLLVIEPDHAVYRHLLNCIEPAVKRKGSQNLDAGDQDVFQEANKDWPAREELHLPEIYNCLYGMLNSVCKVNQCSPDDLKVIHFTGRVKPWDHGRFFAFKMLAANILKGGDKENLFARLRIWQKYRNYCQPIKR